MGQQSTNMEEKFTVESPQGSKPQVDPEETPRAADPPQAEHGQTAQPQQTPITTTQSEGALASQQDIEADDVRFYYHSYRLSFPH